MNDEPPAFISTVIENELTDVLQALADPVRLAIVRELAASEPEPRACGTFRLGVSNSTLTHHLKVLREAGVIDTRPEGHLRLNRLRRDELDKRFPGLLDSVLRPVDRV